MEEVLEVPQGISEEQKQGFARAFGTNVPAAQTPETPVETPATPTPEAVVIETPAVVETPVETPTENLYKGSQLMEIFGSENLDEVKTNYSTLRERAEKLEAIEKEAEELRGFRGFIEKPFTNERLADIDKFGRQTGVTDVEVANRFVGKAPDEIGQNPIEAMALAEVIQNPDSYKNIPFSKVVAAMAEETGIEGDTKPQDLTNGQQLRLQRAVNTIAGAMTKEDSYQSPWSTYQAKTTEQKQAFQQILDSWKDVPILTDKEYVYKQEAKGDIPAFEVKQEIPAEIQKQVQTEINQIINDHPTLYSVEAQKRLATWARGRVSQLMSPSTTALAVEKAIDSLKGVLKEQIVKDYHNGAEIIRPERTPTGETTENPISAVLNARKFN